MTKSRAVSYLVCAGVLWGFGFVATIWALRELTTLQFLIDRFVIALVLGAPLLLKKSKQDLLQDIKISIPAGLALSLTMFFQTQGLLTTTAANSGFLTCLYVVFIPILHFIFWKHRPRHLIFISVLLACIGTYLLSGAHFDKLTVGDGLTVICAFFASLQIMWIGHSSKKTKNAFVYNYFQSFWCLLFLFPFAIFEGNWKFPETAFPWSGLLMTAVGSTLIAFAIQVKAQRYLSTTLASLLCLLEAPFALLFGFLFLSERMGLVQIGGALIIFVSAILAIISELPQGELSEDLTKMKSQL